MRFFSERTGSAATQGYGLQAFTTEELDTLHFATLHLFENVGIQVEDTQAVEVFQAAGAKVEKTGAHWRVKVPQHLVEDCVRWAPSSVLYCGRTPEHDFIAQPGRVGFAMFGECVNIIDPQTRQLRPTVKKDCRDTALLCDALPEICIMERSVCPGDQMPETQTVHNLDAMISGTGKHIILGTGGRRNLEVMIRLGEAAMGDADLFRKRPIFTATVCPTSPLTLVKHCCEGIITAAENGLGICIVTMALSGGTAPITAAGTVLQHNVETLSALTLAQLVRRGTPCTYGSCTTILDLKKAVSAVGAPEYGLLNAAIAKMAQYYKLPCLVGGGLSDAKIPDAQVGYEFAINALTSALAGANIVFGSGGLDSAMTFDYAKLMMDHNGMQYIRKILSGVPVDKEQLAMEVIESVGPGGSYLMHPQTFKGMRSQSQSTLFDRNSREKWLETTEGTPVTERAYAEALQILEKHQPPELPQNAETQMQHILKEYEEECRVSIGSK